MRDDRLLAVLGEIGDEVVRIGVLGHCADRHLDDDRRRIPPMAIRARAVAAGLGDIVLLELQVEQGGQARRGFEDHVAAVAAVAAIRPAVGHMLFAAKTPHAVPAASGFHEYFDLVHEHDFAPCILLLTKQTV